MGYPDGTQEGRQVHTEHLPPDIREALAEYDDRWQAGAYGHGLFASDPLAEASADQWLRDLITGHVDD
jgi:hypothetical protein